MEEKKETLYSNNVLLNVSAYDIQINFYKNGKSFTYENGKYEGENISEHVATINMSIQHAKAFAIMLMENIKNYEKTFGEINLRPQKMDREKIKMDA